MKKMTKSEAIKKHILKKKSITSWDAIMLYKATRLSAIIHCLRKKGFNIATKDVKSKDINGNDVTFAKYVLVSSPK
jgi:hypothetical protein